jgi:hypothetical protein
MEELARWLLEDGLVTNTELEQAERVKHDRGVPLTMALIELEVLSEPELVGLVAKRHGMPKAPRKLHKMTIPPKALSSIPQDHCWQHGVFPFGIDLPSKTLQVAILDPKDDEALKLLQHLPGGLEADLYIAGPKQLEKAIRKHFLDSIVDDTNAPGLRFFGYDGITNPGLGASPSAGHPSLEGIALAEPDFTPVASAPEPEPALAADAGFADVPLPPPRPPTGEIHAVGPRPSAVAVSDFSSSDSRPPISGNHRVAIDRLQPGGSAVEQIARLRRRVNALERAMMELLGLFARNSLDLSDKAERIAGALGRELEPDD